MPALSARFVRLSLVYLALGFSLGAVLLADKALGFFPAVWKLLPIHIEILLLGWFVQLAMGIAYWILPRLPGSSPRGRPLFVQLAFWLVNIGIALVVIETFTHASVLLFLGRLAELGGVLAFLAASWKRVKSFSR